MSKEKVDEIIRAAGGVPPVDDSKRVLTDGSPVTDDHRELKPNGQQRAYVVLSEEERRRGFVRPVRRAYRHVGQRPKNPIRDLTPEEHQQYDRYGYVKYEPYPPGKSAVVGMFWTAEMLNSGCGEVTTMSQEIAETYARSPKFYGATFCVACSKHLPVAQFTWVDDPDQVVGS